MLNSRISAVQRATSRSTYCGKAAGLSLGVKRTPWLQLRHTLRDLITFDLSPGDRIPTEAERCAQYGLSAPLPRFQAEARIGFVADVLGRAAVEQCGVGRGACPPAARGGDGRHQHGRCPREPFGALGRPLTDPKQSKDRIGLPIGGYQGSGLALMRGLLAGPLNRAAFGREWRLSTRLVEPLP